MTQDQKIISGSDGTITLNSGWTSYTTSAVAPANAWSVTVTIKVTGSYVTADFDDVMLSRTN